MEYFKPSERIKFAIRRDRKVGEAAARRLNNEHQARRCMDWLRENRERAA